MRIFSGRTKDGRGWVSPTPASVGDVAIRAYELTVGRSEAPSWRRLTS